MAEPISIQQLKDASEDAISLGEAVNGDENSVVITRLGETYPTLSNAINQIDSKLDSADAQIKQGITNLFENGGLPATPFETKALMTASALVDGDYAMVTDDTTSNGLYVKSVGVWVKSSYDPIQMSKTYTDKLIYNETKTYKEADLTFKGFIYTGSVSQNYNSSAFVPVHGYDKITLAAQVFGTNRAYSFYDFNKIAIVTALPTEPYNGIFTVDITVPKDAFYIRVMSANENKEGYIADSFSLTLRKIHNDATSNTNDLLLNYDKFIELGNDGVLGRAITPNYKYLVTGVLPNQVISYAGLYALGIPTVIIYDSKGDKLKEYTTGNGSIVAPPLSAYVGFNSITESHEDFTPDKKESFLFKVTSLNLAAKLNKLNENSLSIKKAENHISLLQNNGAITYSKSAFKPIDGDSTHSTTGYIDVLGFSKCFVRLSTSDTLVVRGKNASGDISDLLIRSTVPQYMAKTIDIPSDIVSIEVIAANETHEDYSESFSPLVVLSNKVEDINNKLKELYRTNSFTGFPILNKHATSPATTYDSTVKIPVTVGMIIDYSVYGQGFFGQILNGDSMSVASLTKRDDSIKIVENGYIVLSTYNNTHASYHPDMEASYKIYFPEDLEAVSGSAVQQIVAGAYLPTPVLKTVREVAFLDGSDKTAIQYLWYDADLNFFISASKRGDKKFIFKYNPEDFYGLQPHEFSMGFDAFGNIICVYRIEQLPYNHTDDSRKNPIVLVKADNYKGVIVDFGEAKKPSGWLQNCGFLCTETAIYLTEYTRPSVATANTWKATYPLTTATNWKTVQTFNLSPEVNPPDNMKHIHNVDRDPFTGHIYTTIGDHNVHAAMYASTDTGDTFDMILGGSEKYCRVLNFVFTKDWIYWATDSNGEKHWFFKAPRDASGLLDVANITDVLMFPIDSKATYATIYMKKINALVFLGRNDGDATSIPIDLWDFTTDTLVRLDVLPSVGGLPKPLGFRCECFEYYPRDNEIICGYSKALGAGGYENHLGILGNSIDVTKKVNNLILTIERVGTEFTISYDTVI